MGKLSSVIAALVGGAALLGASSAQAATTLLSLIDPPGQTGTPYSLDFTGGERGDNDDLDWRLSDNRV